MNIGKETNTNIFKSECRGRVENPLKEVGDPGIDGWNSLAGAATSAKAYNANLNEDHDDDDDEKL